jgi:hypothetical protein
LSVEGSSTLNNQAVRDASVSAPPPFALKAVIVCDKYDDFLRQTIPENKFHFDRVVVVTSHEDYATRRVCEFYHVECIPTDELNTRKKQFCKGTGVNVGLKALGIDDAKEHEWFLHLDADIWLPPQTRSLLAWANLDKEQLYGIDRFMVRGQEEWHRFREKEILDLQHEDYTWVHADTFPIGTRVCAYGGYVPLGFFQMWNPVASGVKAYPQGHTTAAREDIIFATNWPRAKRTSIPELIGYHLESKDAAHASNWGGRKSARFNITGE